ncbi:MAG: sulfurtransferase TusA family protein [Pseudomonadota bacterium]|jgi:tRNA 2-thiouridine synthesizing protein A|nr:sulfurtransferase TusA family protein [Pseudomonadota bacterium]
MSDFDHELDVRGLNCPLPILRAKKMLNTMASGEVLKVMATDPGAVRDFEAFARQTGNSLLDSTETGAEFHFLLQKFI